MEREPIYSESTLRIFVAIGRITVNLIWISCILSLVNSSTHWYSIYNEIEGEYKEDIISILGTSFYLSLPITAAIWIIKDQRLKEISF